MKKIIFSLLLLNVANAQKLPAENPAEQRQVKIRPTIMVFPFFKENENIRKVVEEDENKRLVISKVKEMFDTRGYSTIDFLSKARNLVTTQALSDENKADLKTQIVEASGADISVEVEYQYNVSPTGNEVKLILSAYESSTSSSLSNKVGLSGKFYSDDIGKLANRAANTIAEDFLNVLQLKFDDIVENGRYLNLEFGISQDSYLKMKNPIGSDELPLSDVLEEWVSENTKSYHIQGVTDDKVLFDVIRVPRIEENGNVLTTSKFSLGIMKFCKSLVNPETGTKLKVLRTINGNKIIITLI